MGREEALVRFEDVSFEYSAVKPILDEVNFAVRRGMKLAIMGQNGRASCRERVLLGV